MCLNSASSSFSFRSVSPRCRELIRSAPARLASSSYTDRLPLLLAAFSSEDVPFGFFISCSFGRKTMHTVSNNSFAVVAEPKLKAFTPFISSTLSPTLRSLQSGGTAATELPIKNDNMCQTLAMIARFDCNIIIVTYCNNTHPEIQLESLIRCLSFLKLPAAVDLENCPTCCDDSKNWPQHEL